MLKTKVVGLEKKVDGLKKSVHELTNRAREMDSARDSLLAENIALKDRLSALEALIQRHLGFGAET